MPRFSALEGSGRPGLQGQAKLHSAFEANIGYMRPCPKREEWRGRQGEGRRKRERGKVRERREEEREGREGERGENESMYYFAIDP